MRTATDPVLRIPWPTTWTWISLAAVGFVVWGLVSDPGPSTDPEALFDPHASTTERLRAAEYWVAQGPAAVPRMMEALRNPQVDVRAQAAFVLGRIGPPARRALPLLVERLEDDSAKVRGNVLFAVFQVSGNRNDVAAQAGELLADEDTFVRETAGEVLAQCGDAALPNALRLTRHESNEVREASLRLLSQIAPDRREVQDVARLHLTDPDPAVRVAAFTVLDRGRAFTAADLLIGVSDADCCVREIVLQQRWPRDEASAAAAAPKLAAVLAGALEESAASDIDDLEDFDGAPAGDAIHGGDTYDQTEMFAALRVLESLGRPAAAAAPQVATLAESPHARVRRAAVQTLTSLIAEPGERLRLLEPLVLDRDDRVAYAAGRALADCPADAASRLIPPLKSRLAGADPEQQRSAAAALCGLSPHPETLPIFRTALDDHDPQVRFWAIRGLSMHGSEADALLPELLARLRKDWETTSNQTELLVALRRIGPAARAALPELLEKYSQPKAPSQCVVEAMRTAVALAPDDPLVRDFTRTLFRTSRSGWLRAEALRTAWTLEAPTLEAFVLGSRSNASGSSDPRSSAAAGELIQLTGRGLKDSNPRVRVIACGLLAEHGSRVPEPLAAELIELVNDEDAMVRYMACRALEAVGPRAAVAVPTLMVALSDEENGERWYELTMVEADRELIQSLGANPRATVRASAKAALKSIAPTSTFTL